MYTATATCAGSITTQFNDNKQKPSLVFHGNSGYANALQI